MTTDIETDHSLKGIPSLASVDAKLFTAHSALREEVFGPLSLVVVCENYEEMTLVANIIEGQLTATIIADESELAQRTSIAEAIKDKCGRLIFNGVPTGVQVSFAQNHGGPFPATTDSRFSAVGADGIKRFSRPVTYQNYPEALLPPELQNSNPLKIIRTVNNKMTTNSI